MTVVADIHESHGATFTERGGRRVVDHYGRPERVHRAVRNVVGVIEMGYGVVEVTGDDRIEFVDNAVSNRVPSEDGQGVYALLLDSQGGIETDLYVFNAGERLLCFVPPQRADDLAEEWAEKTFIQDVEVRVATDDFGVFGVHGPKATEKIASVLTGPGSPDEPLSFVRGTVGDWGVTVVRTDDLTGEEGYESSVRPRTRTTSSTPWSTTASTPRRSATGRSITSRWRPGRQPSRPNSKGRSRTSSACGTPSISRRAVTSAKRSSRR
jgi:aminomethyltransferase